MEEATLKLISPKISKISQEMTIGADTGISYYTAITFKT